MQRMQVPDKVLQWLHSSLKPQYTDVDRTYSDIAKTLAGHPSLSPRTDVYSIPSVSLWFQPFPPHVNVSLLIRRNYIAFDNGSSGLLIVLQGTLAVPFRGATYRFPIATWIPYTYPYEPPMIYIAPTNTMAVRPGQHVSIEGRIYHPYLAQWREHWKVSNLLDMLSILRDAFAKEPPVVSRDSRELSLSKSPARNLSGAVETLHLETAFGSRQSSVPMPTQQISPPPPPPKPPEVSGVSARLELRSQAENGIINNSVPPLLPPKPPQPNGHISSFQPVPATEYPSNLRQPQHTQQRELGVASTYSPSPTGHGISSTGPSIDPRQRSFSSGGPGDMQGQLQLNQLPHRTTEGATPYGLHPLPVQHSGQFHKHPPPPNHLVTSASQSFPVEVRKPIEDLLSGPIMEATPPHASPNATHSAPPIPPNPEKDGIVQAISSALESRLSQTVTQNIAALPALESQYAAMQQAYQNMQNEFSQLQQLEEMLASNEKILHEAMREADRVMESVGRREVPKVDDVLVAPTVVGEQLYGLVADVRGISDAMFALTRALDKGRVGGDVFIKQTRILARERFFKEALIKKIARGMGLAIEDV